MSKLFKLKKWLTLEEAAVHISNVLDEAVTIADLLRFALDGYLTLSVDFVNHTQARKGKWVKTEDVESIWKKYSMNTGEKNDLPITFPKNHELIELGGHWIILNDSPTPLLNSDFKK
ncbi:hypothetical protein KKI24_26890 [bacterium]|nr:hypothetical protein [bacterium]